MITARKRIKDVSLALLTMLVMVVAGYFLLAFIGSAIPQNGDREVPQDGIDLLIETNGTHTGIVVPIYSPQKDWTTTFPTAADPLPDGSMPTHIAIGMGEREVFLSVPTWGDLKPSTALRIATVGGETVLRVSRYVRPMAGEHHRNLRVSEAEYVRLINAIEAQLPPVSGGEREVLRGTYADDSYYTAFGRYTLGNTCNEWVGERLTEAGLPMGLWTPLAGGVMKWIPEEAGS